MTEIREFTAIKKRDEITGQELLAWARAVEEQRAKKALIKATKENKTSYEGLKVFSKTELEFC